MAPLCSPVPDGYVYSLMVIPRQDLMTPHSPTRKGPTAQSLFLTKRRFVLSNNFKGIIFLSMHTAVGIYRNE